MTDTKQSPADTAFRLANRHGIRHPGKRRPIDAIVLGAVALVLLYFERCHSAAPNEDVIRLSPRSVVPSETWQTLP
jgi:hypothetical protein